MQRYLEDRAGGKLSFGSNALLHCVCLKKMHLHTVSSKVWLYTNLSRNRRISHDAQHRLRMKDYKDWDSPDA